MLPWIDAAPDVDFSAIPVSDQAQATSWSGGVNDSRTPPIFLTRRRTKFTMRTQLNSAKASSDDVLLID